MEVYETLFRQLKEGRMNSERETERRKVNLLLEKFLPEMNNTISLIDHPVAEFILLEGLTAGALLTLCIRHNRDPDQLIEAFTEGLRERFKEILEGDEEDDP